MTIGTVEPMAGVFPVLPCVFDAVGRVDERGLRSVLEYAIKSGVDGVVFPGVASEYELLEAEERDHLVTSIGEWIGGRVKFVVGASAPSLELVAQYAKRGAQSGASAAMIMTPHALASDLAGMARFFSEVGGQTGLPIMLQNAPPPTGIGLSIDSIASLLEISMGISYVKEETPPCGQRITGILDRTPKGLLGVFGGAGSRHIIDEMNRGAAGTMPACDIVEILVAMVAAYRNGEVVRARDLYERSLPLLSMQAVFRWRLTKEVLLRRGLIESTYTRAQGPALDTHDRKELDDLLNRLTDLIEPLRQ